MRQSLLKTQPTEESPFKKKKDGKVDRFLGFDYYKELYRDLEGKRAHVNVGRPIPPEVNASRKSSTATKFLE